MTFVLIHIFSCDIDHRDVFTGVMRIAPLTMHLTFFPVVFFIKMTFYSCDNKVFNIITLITFKYLYIMVNLHFEVTGILTSQVV